MIDMSETAVLDRLHRVQLLGGEPTIDYFVLNLQHAYQLFFNCFEESPQRKVLWEQMHLYARGIVDITSLKCPDPSRNLFAEREKD